MGSKEVDQLVQELKKAISQYDTAQGKPPKPCPHCGHCPTCGRANKPYDIHIYPYPWYPYPWSVPTPFWLTTSGTSTNWDTSNITYTTTTTKTG